MKRNHFHGYFKNLAPFHKLYDYNFQKINLKHKNIGGISIPPYIPSK